MSEEPRKRSKPPYNPSWESEFLIAPYGDGAQCLVCETPFTHLKRSNIERHYKNAHAADFDNKTVAEREEFITQKKEEKLPEEDCGNSQPLVRSSYKIALRLARAGKPFSKSEDVKGCIQDFVNEVEPSPSRTIAAEKVPLSRRNMTRRLVDISEDLCDQLKSLTKTFVAYSLALDESTDITDTAQLAMFIRGVNDQLEVTEEFLDISPMMGTTTGQDIYDAVDVVRKRFEIKNDNLESVGTDGAPAMVGRQTGFCGIFQKELAREDLECIPIHCLVHQENLCAKSVVMKHVMGVVVTTTNTIKAQGLNHRQFREFLDELDSEYGDLGYYTEVRWLSRGKLLLRFYHPLPAIILFMDIKFKPVPQLSDPSWITDLAFLTDITGHLNKLNLQLQGRSILVTNLFDYVAAFKVKLSLWKGQLQNKNADHFPLLKARIEHLSGEKINRYITILDTLLNEFEERFIKSEKFNQKLQIFRIPFSDRINLEALPPDLQCELIDLRSDDELTDKYERRADLMQFYRNFPKNRFPMLHKNAAQVLSMFGTTYCIEQLFSVMKGTKSKERSRLTNENLVSLLRVKTTKSLVPRITDLANR